MPGTDAAYAALPGEEKLRGGAWEGAHAFTRSAICLRLRYAMSGTDLAYSAICLRLRFAMSGTDMSGTDMSGSDIPSSAICLRLRYAVSGIDIPSSGIGLCLRYAVSGTEIACAAIRAGSGAGGARQRPGCTSYAMPGTDVAYGATSAVRCPILILCMGLPVLCAAQY
eukprot:458488-Rhodomonas_salina.7